MPRTPFPRVFWTGNAIEILERFAYYGLYMGFQIFATKTVLEGGLGWSEARLGVVQSVFLFLSYSVPLISSVLADRYGFKRMLMLSYVLYLPGFVFLTLTREFAAVLAVTALIAVAAGLFKPLIAGTVRLTTDNTNRTLGPRRGRHDHRDLTHLPQSHRTREGPHQTAAPGPAHPGDRPLPEAAQPDGVHPHLRRPDRGAVLGLLQPLSHVC